MAEGWAKALKGEKYNFYSAGIETHGLNPNAVKVMAEEGIDITNQESQLLTDLDHINFDIVFTVCSNAHETCPVFPKQAKVIHHGFDDPPKLAQHADSEESRLQPYRRVRDEIKSWIEHIDEDI